MIQNNRQKPATKGDIEDLKHDFGVSRKQTKNDLDDLAVQIVTAISKELENYSTKEDLKNVEQRLGGKIDKLSYDVSDLRGRVIDLEIKHGSPHAHAA